MTQRNELYAAATSGASPSNAAPISAGVRVGLEVCLASPPPVLRGARLGLLMNQASVDGHFRYACDLLAERFPGQLAALFSPQHGLWGEQQANMIETPHGRYEPLGLPVYSLYSQTRRPTEEMLRGLDCLVIDLQDVGTRVYTFAWTVLHCLEACAAAGLPVVLLDRPNPTAGQVAEGPLLDNSFKSFVGGAAIPLRHGLTLGELARLVNAEQAIGAALHVVPMQGWRREMLFDGTGRAWVPPSPNMPRWQTALLYPGEVLLEGTNVSEGRGTTTPFELVGAPFIDPFRLARELVSFDLPGLQVRPVRFVPTFDKWRGQSCGGVAWHICDAAAVRSVRATLAILAVVRRLWPDEFALLPPPYEYETERMPLDILYGSAALRERLLSGVPLTNEDTSRLPALDEAAWRQRISGCLLYDHP
jgi:uncharacterized protein YbbC (DUF1343 family)